MYGRSAALARGDYRRYARLRGDPGLRDLFGKALGVVGKVLPGPAGAIASAAGRILSRGGSAPRAPAASALAQTGGSMVGIRAGGPRGLTIGYERTQGVRGYAEGQLPTVSGVTPDGCPKGFHTRKAEAKLGMPGPCVRNRRMNVANPAALRRSIRRGRGFTKLARKAVRPFGLVVARSGRGKVPRKR